MSDETPAHFPDFVATGVSAYNGQAFTDEGMVAVHALVFTNQDGETLEILYPPFMSANIVEACRAMSSDDVQTTHRIAREQRRRRRRK